MTNARYILSCFCWALSERFEIESFIESITPIDRMPTTVLMDEEHLIKLLVRAGNLNMRYMCRKEW